MKRINGTVAKVGAWLTLLPLAYGIWWLAGHVAHAEDQTTEQAVLKEAVIELKAIHVKMATVEEAEAALLEKLCRTGKLKSDDCPVHLYTPVPPPPRPQ